MRQTPLHKPFHRTIDAIPTGLKGSRRLSPGQPPCPARQKSHHRQGDRSFALAPGKVFHHHSMRRTFHSPRLIQKVGLDAPQWHEQPGPLGQPVIARSGLATLRALAAEALMRLQADLNTTEPTSGATQPDVLVYKACKMLNPVQKRLNFQLHRWSLGSLCLIDLDIDSVTQDQLLFHRPPDFLPSSSRATFLYGPGDRALQECNLSTQFVRRLQVTQAPVPRCGIGFLLWSCSCKHGPKRKTHGSFLTKSLFPGGGLSWRCRPRAGCNRVGCEAEPR